MRTSTKYLIGYCVFFLLERMVLSLFPPLLSASITIIVCFAIMFYEGNRFNKFLEENYKEVVDEYRRRTITGGVWLQKYIRTHMKLRDTSDVDLVSHCKRIFYVMRLGFLALISLTLAGIM